MTRGRPRMPKELKIIHGTFRKDRNPEEQPEPTKINEIPKPPKGLNRHAKRLWKDLSEELVDAGILTTVDLPALEICCVNYGLYKDAHEAVYSYMDTNPKTGRMKRFKRSLADYMRGKNSQTIPEYTAMTKAFENFKAYLIEFGLTPASRNRLQIPERPYEEDPMEKLNSESL